MWQNMSELDPVSVERVKEVVEAIVDNSVMRRVLLWLIRMIFVIVDIAVLINLLPI